MENFDKENFVKLSKGDCRKIKAAAARYPGRECKEDLVYELKLCCHHGGKNWYPGQRVTDLTRPLQRLDVLSLSGLRPQRMDSTWKWFTVR